MKRRFWVWFLTLAIVLTPTLALAEWPDSGREFNLVAG